MQVTKSLHFTKFLSYKMSMYQNVFRYVKLTYLHKVLIWWKCLLYIKMFSATLNVHFVIKKFDYLFQLLLKTAITVHLQLSGGQETWNFLWMEGFRGRGNLKLSLNGRFQGERKLEIFSDWKVSGGEETWNYLWMESFRRRGNLKFSL